VHYTTIPTHNGVVFQLELHSDGLPSWGGSMEETKRDIVMGMKGRMLCAIENRYFVRK